MELAAIRFYDVVVFVHVAAVVVVFGATFAPGFFQVIPERVAPRSLPGAYRAMQRYLVNPGSLVVLAAGVYLVIDGPFGWDEPFVGVGLALFIVTMGIANAILQPATVRAGELAERDIAAAGAGEVQLSDEYWAASRRIATTGTLANVLILVILFFMVVKP